MEPTETLEALVLETIQAAAVRVFATMLDKQLVRREVHDEAAEGNTLWGVSAQISMVGACSITSLLNCSEATACAIASAMLMEERATLDAEVLDAMAEMANMILGNVKADLEGQLGPTTLSIPTVISGGSFTVYNNSRKWNVVAFDVEGAPFTVKLCFEPPPKEKAKPSSSRA